MQGIHLNLRRFSRHGISFLSLLLLLPGTAFSSALHLSKDTALRPIRTEKKLSLGSWQQAAAKLADSNEVEPLAETTPLALGKNKDSEGPYRWYVGFGLINAYPHMKSERIINDWVEPGLNFLAPNFGEFNTFGDIRDKGLFLPPQFVFGRNVGKRWSFGMHGGYSSGTLRTNKSKASILLGLPIHVDVELTRYAWYFGLDADYYPFGRSELRPYRNWYKRIRAIKPRLSLSYTWTYAGYRAHAKAGIGWPQSLLNIRLSQQWFAAATNPSVGFDIPIGPRDSLSFGVGRTYFPEYSHDFAGWNATLSWRHFFR
jgi:hypothetical protein